MSGTAGRTDAAGAAGAPGNPSLAAAGWRRTIRDRPLIPLVFLLFGLVVVLELAKPGIVNGGWVGTISNLVLLLAVAIDVYNKTQGRFSIIGLFTSKRSSGPTDQSPTPTTGTPDTAKPGAVTVNK